MKNISFNEDNEDQVIREVKIMAQLHHPNITWIEEDYELSSADDDSYDTNTSNLPTKTLVTRQWKT